MYLLVSGRMKFIVIPFQKSCDTLVHAEPSVIATMLDYIILRFSHELGTSSDCMATIAMLTHSTMYNCHYDSTSVYVSYTKYTHAILAKPCSKVH